MPMPRGPAPDVASRRGLGSRLRTAAAMARLLGPYALYALLKRVMALQTLARHAWSPGRDGCRSNAGAVVAPIVGLAHLVGANRGDCVQLALVCYRELSRAGFEPVLMLGLAPAGAGKSEGHAWVELDGRPVVEPLGSVVRFTPIVAFGAEGRSIPVHSRERP